MHVIMNNKFITLIISLTVGVLCNPLAVMSQADTIYLEEILVEAKKADDILKTNISGKTLELENPHDVGEIFKRQAGFGVIKRGNYAMEPVLRGFKYEQLNVQFNGGSTSTNACPNRMDPAISQIAPEDIEKVEVIKGPYSVRFGPSTGGVLNIITKRPEKSEKLKVSGAVDGGYQTNGSNYFGGLSLMLVDKGYDVLFDAGYKNFGNYKSGSGEEIPSSFNRFGYSFKFGLNPADNHRIQISWNQGFAKDILHAGLPMDADKDNSSMLAIDYQGSSLSKSVFLLKAKIFGTYVDHEMSNKLRPNYKIVHAVTPVTAWVYGGRTELGIKASENDLMYVGIDYKYVGKDGTRTREIYKNACTGAVYDPPVIKKDLVWQDSKKNDLGLFFENKYEVNHSLLWLLGVRLDHITYAIDDPAPDFMELYDNDVQPDNNLNISVNTSLTWEVTGSIEIQWAAGRGVRSPELTELFINHFNVGMDAYEYVGDPHLKPETNYQTDIRVEKRWKSATLYGDIFYSYMTNYITAKVDTTLPRKFLPCKDPKFAKRFTNIDEAYRFGFEAGFDIRFLEKFRYNINAAYTFAQNKSWDEPLSEIPPFAINSSLGYFTEKITADVKVRIDAAQNRISESFDESTTPGFAVFDFFFSYEPLKMLELQFAVTNIFNKNYVDHLSRPYKNLNEQSLYYEPGRSFNFGVKFKF